MGSTKPVKTPVDIAIATSTKLVKGTKGYTEGEDSIDQQLYQSAVGLLYLSVGTRSDITYAVSNVTKFSSHPANKHWTGVKRIKRYLKDF